MIHLIVAGISALRCINVVETISLRDRDLNQQVELRVREFHRGYFIANRTWVRAGAQGLVFTLTVLIRYCTRLRSIMGC